MCDMVNIILECLAMQMYLLTIAVNSNRDGAKPCPLAVSKRNMRQMAIMQDNSLVKFLNEKTGTKFAFELFSSYCSGRASKIGQFLVVHLA